MSGRVLSKHFRKSNIMNKGGLFVQHFISLLYHWVLFSIVCFVSLTLGRLVIQKPTSPPSDNAAGKATLKVADPSISHGRVRVGIMIRKRRHPPQLSAFYKKEMHLQISLGEGGACAISPPLVRARVAGERQDPPAVRRKALRVFSPFEIRRPVPIWIKRHQSEKIGDIIRVKQTTCSSRC